MPNFPKNYTGPKTLAEAKTTFGPRRTRALKAKGAEIKSGMNRTENRQEFLAGKGVPGFNKGGAVKKKGLKTPPKPMAKMAKGGMTKKGKC